MDKSPPVGSRAHVRFEVEKVIGVSSDGNYQVQWAPAWVSKFHLVGCEHLIQEFLEKAEKMHDLENQSEAAASQVNEFVTPESTLQPSLNDNSSSAYSNDPDQVVGEAIEEHKPDLDAACMMNNPVKQILIDNDVRPEEGEISVKIEQEETMSDLYPTFAMESLLPLSMHESHDVTPTNTTSNTNSSAETCTNQETFNYIFVSTSNMGTNELKPGNTSTHRTNLHPHKSTHAVKKKPSSGNPQDPKYSCPQCTYTAMLKTDLTRHLRTHTGEKPFHCNECGKSFAVSGNLKVHQRIHSGEKPYACTYCDKKFRNSGNLKEHTRIHTGEMPFLCGGCGKRFIYASGLTNHAKSCIDSNVKQQGET